MKCAGKHTTIDCPKSTKEEAKCVNCGGSHPASYRGCIVAKELQEIRNKKQAKTNATELRAERNPSHQPKEQNIGPKTYASVAASNTSERLQADSSISQSIQLILQKIMNMEGSITSINEKVNNLESRIKGAARADQQ